MFDLDGTLVDSYRAIATSLDHARAGFGLSPLSQDEVRRMVGHGLESLIERVLGPDRVEAGVRLFRERYAQVYAELTSPLPGAARVVRELRGRGYRLSLASNKPARFCDAILATLGMLDAFDTVQGPDRTGVTKPDPRMIGACLSGMGVARAAAVYVGDMVLDVESAARAGIPVLLVEGGSSTAVELASTGQRVLGSLTELLDILPVRPGGRADVQPVEGGAV